MEFRSVLVITLVMLNMVVVCYGKLPHRPFSELKNSLFVEATASKTGGLMAGVDKITVQWGTLKNVTPSIDEKYKTVKVKLCYTPISQIDRPWRNTNLDNIAKDKTCQFVIITADYKRGVTDNATYTISQDIPGAIYFIRAYVFDGEDKEQGYGQTAIDKPFTVVGITGRSTGIDAAAGVFSAFSVVSLAYFFYMEKRKAKKSAAAVTTTTTT